MAIEHITRNFIGASVQTSLLLGIPPKYREHTTLNEKFDILPTHLPASNQWPRMQYFTIGNRGHRSVPGADGITLIDPVQHSGMDGALFGHLPFVLRDPVSDLTAAERQKYALRKEVTIDKKRYIAYYLKRIDMTGVSVEEEIHTYKDGAVVSTTPLVPDSSVLNPVPQLLSNEGVNVTDGRYAVVTAKIKLTFNRAEIDDLLNVATIMFGDSRYAIISEIGLVTAVDKVISVENPGQGSFNFNEVVGAQLISHINVNYPAAFANNLIEAVIDVGAQEPLFKLTHRPTP